MILGDKILTAPLFLSSFNLETGGTQLCNFLSALGRFIIKDCTGRTVGNIGLCFSPRKRRFEHPVFLFFRNLFLLALPQQDRRFILSTREMSHKL